MRNGYGWAHPWPNSWIDGIARLRSTEASIDDVQSALRDGRITCRGLVEAYLARIRAYDKAGPALNAVQTISTRALEQADRLDAAFNVSGPVGRLHCVPTLVKDQIDTMEVPTTHGFVGFKDFVPQTDATVISRLKAAGALIIAKATMGEFASGYISSMSGPIRSAYDPRRSASGSSGVPARESPQVLRLLESARTREVLCDSVRKRADRGGQISSRIPDLSKEA